MYRAMLRRIVFVGVVMATTLMFSAETNAGWNHWRGYAVPVVGWTGYNYSYYGGWGGVGYDCCRPAYTPCYTPCYDPCYTPCYTPCYDPCDVGCGGLLSRIAYRWRTHHYGYYWGWGRCGWVAPGCCGTCGYPAADCCCGSADNGIIYGEPSVVPESTPMTPTPANPAEGDGQGLPVPEKQTSLTPDSALLTVTVPDTAQIFVNGMPTQSTGNMRRYVSRNLTPGFNYTYEVRAELNLDGTPVVRTKTVQLRAGEKADLAFDLSGPPRVETSLTLRVPSDARVFLAGNETRGTGPIRTFRTTKLADGQEWSQYAVRVVANRDGEEVTDEKVITLRTGDQREMTFDFQVDKVASIR